jgi:hypothetical protein
MVVDASALAATGPPDTDILIITDDQFGRTLAAELPAVSWAAYDSALPSNWAAFLKARSLEKYFEAINGFRERRHRTQLVFGALTESISGMSGVSGVSGVSADSVCSHVTRASWSRASWSRPASAVGETRRSRMGIPMQGRRIGDASSAASQLNTSKDALEVHANGLQELNHQLERSLAPLGRGMTRDLATFDPCIPSPSIRDRTSLSTSQTFTLHALLEFSDISFISSRDGMSSSR